MSGFATLSLLAQGGLDIGTDTSASIGASIGIGTGTGILSTALKALGPMTSALFIGFAGRELLMDLQDYDSDKAAGLETVPVKYGRRISTQVALGCMILTGVLTTLGPLLSVLSMSMPPSWFVSSLWWSENGLSMLQNGPMMKLVMGLLGSSSLIRGAWNVYKTEGRDLDLVSKAVEGGKLSIVFILAAFL